MLRAKFHTWAQARQARPSQAAAEPGSGQGGGGGGGPARNAWAKGKGGGLNTVCLRGWRGNARLTAMQQQGPAPSSTPTRPLPGAGSPGQEGREGEGDETPMPVTDSSPPPSTPSIHKGSVADNLKLLRHQRLPVFFSRPDTYSVTSNTNQRLSRRRSSSALNYVIVF